MDGLGISESGGGGMRNVDFKSAQAFYPELARAIEAVPHYVHKPTLEQQEARTLKLRAVIALVEAKGGRIEDKWSGASVRLFGLRATSTSGIIGACNNWITQLTLKSMAAQMGGAA